MDMNFWLNKWQEGDIRFHQKKYHPQLEKYGDQFQEGVILVPLCGKTLDMLYLAAHGHMVVGVELSPIACQDFFIENGIHYTETKRDDFMVYDSDNIQIWCGDFFKLPQNVWDKISGIYDRAALVALPKEVREQYASCILERTKNLPHLEILLISFEYPEETVKGPPFSVVEHEVQKLYQGLETKLIHVQKDEKYTKDHPTLKSIELKETVYWIKK